MALTGRALFQIKRKQDVQLKLPTHFVQLRKITCHQLEISAMTVYTQVICN